MPLSTQTTMEKGRGARSAPALSPRSVIRGEFGSQMPVSVDFLNFTIPDGRVSEIVEEVCAFLGYPRGDDMGRGLHGYEHCVQIGNSAFVAYGGAAQRGTVLVSLSGAACQRVARFDALRNWAQSLDARITRCDLAADDFDGKHLSVRLAINAFKRGLFDSRGTPCKARVVQALSAGEGSTLYVGRRESGKVCRIYEKGRQLKQPDSPWVRAEVEFHAKDRVLPWDMVTDPVRFLAGAYRYLANFSFIAERIRTFKRITEASLEAVIKWARSAVGKTVNVLLNHCGGDLGEVVFTLRRAGVPNRLRGLWDGDGFLVAGPAS